MDKIVKRGAFPIGKNHILYLEKDNKDEVWCMMYEEDCHMTQREIAKAMGFTEPAICQIVKRGLRKIFKKVRMKNRHLNPIELTALVGELLNVKTDVQFQRYFRALPEEIRKEVSNYAIEKNYH